MNNNLVDLAGKKFGTLTVVRLMEQRQRRSQCLWFALCDCGTEKKITTAALREIRYCWAGCPLRPPPNKTHNLSHSPAYYTWKGMIQRCRNPKDPSYTRYGGIGIDICERWTRFENFLTDMGTRPEETTLDRIEPTGNYEPGNCRWADRQTQAGNKRSSYQLNGVRRTLAEWSRISGIKVATIENRIHHLGWDFASAISVPVKKTRQHYAELRT